MYLPDLAGTGKGHMGERLTCTIHSVTEVRAVTEETLAVRAHKELGERPGGQGRAEWISGASGPTPYWRRMPAVAGSHGGTQTLICKRKR